MGLKHKLFNNTRKPVGILGKYMVNAMNHGGHAVLAEWGLTHIDLSSMHTVLDVGCGGGANIARYLERIPEGKIYGLDYSEVSVGKSREVNQAAIKEGRCEIIQGNVADLPFEENTFDLVSAYETIYFWPGIENCFRQIHKVLKPGATFMIVNESDGHHEESLKWETLIDDMHVYTADEVESALKAAGFEKITIDVESDNDRMTICAVK